MRLEPWAPEYIRLAQQHDNLWVRVYWDGTPLGSILEVSPIECRTSDAASYWVCVRRGVLVLGQTDWVLDGTGLAKLVDTPSDKRRPVDDVPWEIHAIGDHTAHEAARRAYIASRSRLATDASD